MGLKGEVVFSVIREVANQTGRCCKLLRGYGNETHPLHNETRTQVQTRVKNLTKSKKCELLPAQRLEKNERGSAQTLQLICTL